MLVFFVWLKTEANYKTWAEYFPYLTALHVNTVYLNGTC